MVDASAVGGAASARGKSSWLDRGAGVAAALLLLLGSLRPDLPRPAQALVLAALLFALWRIGATAARVAVHDFPSLSSVVASFSFAVAFASVVAAGLGHFGALRPAPFLAIVATALGASLFVGRPATAAHAIVEPPAGDGFATGPRERFEAALTGGTLFAMALGYLSEAVRRFAKPVAGGPDDLSYHLSAIAVWRHWGDLRMLKFSMGDWGTVFYPILPELSGWVLLTPFGDSDVATRWAELPYAVASLVATAAIARRLGLRPSAAVLAAGFYGVLNRVAVLAFAAGNDHVTGFCTLAALDAALACAERPRAGRFAYLGTTLGLLVASKYLGVFFAITILALLALSMLLARGRDGSGERVGARAVLVGAAVVVATAAAVGGYTYLRNWVTTGNPIYPQPVHVAGVELFPGREELSLGGRRGGEQSRIDLHEFLLAPDNLFAGFFPFTLLPAALLAPLVAAAGRRWRDALVLALPVVFFLEFLYLTWDHRDIRYFLAGIALAGVAFGWLTERLGAAGAWLRVGALAVLVLRYVRWMGTRGTRELVVALLLVAAVAIVLRRRPGWAAPARAAAAPALGVALVVACLVLGCNVERFQRVRLSGSPAAEALERLTGGHGETVAYVGLNQPYLYFGRRLQNVVHVVPRSWNLRAEHYRWGGPPDPPFPPSRYRRWLGVMETLGARYVVVHRSADENPERRWMANHWERFRRVYDDDVMEIWRLAPRDEAAGQPAGKSR
jgi:hypothetical protein